MPFLGASMGRMLSGATEGVAQGHLQKMLLDRDESRWNQGMELKREQLGLTAENKRATAVDGFIKGAMNFYKATGNAEATKQFWNQNAPQYGLERIATFQPTDPGMLQIHFENGRGLVVNKLTGAARLVTGPDGDAFQMPRTAGQQADELAGQTRLDMMSGAEVGPTVAAAAGVRLPAEKTAKIMTPMQAMKRKTELLTSRVKLLKGNEMDALIASLNPGYKPGSSVDDKTREEVEAQIDAEIAELDGIIGGRGGQRQAATGQGGNPLAGKPPGRYRVNGQVVKWDGNRVVE
jgi:hypothetical protein